MRDPVKKRRRRPKYLVGAATGLRQPAISG